uniref:MLO-like protein n=1 Tax=Daucus carota subsp. sativus TaxID=79200 RepID=A0A175YEP9_DAUCS
MEGLIREGRSLAETPTWSVATVTTVMVFLCLLVQRSLYKFGRWLKKTRRKALFASVEKIKEEMMLLGLISLLLGQWAGAISQICVDSSLFNSKFFLCSEEDFGIKEHIRLRNSLSLNETVVSSKEVNHHSSHHCGEGREPFVSHEGLEQLHRFLFVLGITHVLYSCIAVGLAMTKIYSWRKWEVLASLSPDSSMQAKLKCSCDTGLNIYFWLSFIPVILVMLVGTKLQHVVSLLALEIVDPRGRPGENQIKPRDGLFWFGKPEVLLRLIQFISFQNAFEMATFIWSLWGMEQRACFMKNHGMIVVRLTSGVIVQFWCSYSTVPLNIIITQMGSRLKKSLIAENVRDSLHSWCKRVKERSKHNAVNSITTRSTCSLGSTIDEGDEIITVASRTISPCSSTGSLNHLVDDSMTNELPDATIIGSSDRSNHELSFRVSDYASYGFNYESEIQDNVDDEEGKVVTLFDLLRKT